MKSNFRCVLRRLAVLATLFVAACGGHSVGLTDGDGGHRGPTPAACIDLTCSSGWLWNAETCSCEAPPAEGHPEDATAGCSMPCPSGSVLTEQAGACFCLYQESDAEPLDATTLDVTEPVDVYSFPSDVEPREAQGGCPFFSYCGPGYRLSASCTCEACTNSCPRGQTPGPSCDGCTACTQSCPLGFDYGPTCNTCVPHGTDAGPMPPPDGGSDAGVPCVLEGYLTCSAGAWCPLGGCPDGKTQYGCYCNTDGTATCSLTCPVPASCSIPGQAPCPPGRQCVYGSCSDPSADVLVCQCSSYGDGGDAYCYTASCANGGPNLPDAGPNIADVTCLLEGNTPCSAGSWCPVGTCPDGTTPYGCLCNADGTATCDLTCPQVPPCNVPGEGTCPYGTSCLFGCSGGTGTGLSCYCESGGTVSCSTVSCHPAFEND